jgi:hypothetical protein
VFPEQSGAVIVSLSAPSKTEKEAGTTDGDVKLPSRKAGWDYKIAFTYDSP